MTIHITIQAGKTTKVCLALVLILITFTFVPTAQAGVGVSGQPYAILAETMLPIASDIKYDKSSGYLVTTANSANLSNTCYIGQINLPNGSTIVGIAAYGVDGDATNDFNVTVWRYNLSDTPVYGSGPITPRVYSSSVTPVSGSKVTLYSPADPAKATVDNVNYSYGVFLQLPAASGSINPSSPTLAVLRFVVYWNYPVFLPSIGS